MIPYPRIAYKHINNYSRFPSPYLFCNDVELTKDMVESFEDTYGVGFSDCLNKNRIYNKALNAINADNIIDYKQTLSFVLGYFTNGGSGKGCSVTPLFKFETDLINAGFEMFQYVELNALTPSSRCYRNGALQVYVSFGLVVDGRKINFYFETNQTNQSYEMNIKQNTVENLLTNNLKPI